MSGGAQVVGAVDGHPALDLLEVVEHPLAVDEQVADHGELGHRRELDVVLAGLGQLLVGQAAAALPHLAVDDHGARPANFFEAARVPHDGLNLLAAGGHRGRTGPGLAGERLLRGLAPRCPALPPCRCWRPAAFCWAGVAVGRSEANTLLLNTETKLTKHPA